MKNKRWVLGCPNDKVAQIKTIRAMTGLGLKEAKDFVDAHCSSDGHVTFDPDELIFATNYTHDLLVIEKTLLEKNNPNDPFSHRPYATITEEILP